MAEGCATSIVTPPIQMNNFKIKHVLLQLIQQEQLKGSPMEDPNFHINNFLQLCDNFKVNVASDDAIQLRLFPILTEGEIQVLVAVTTTRQHHYMDGAYE